MLIKENSTIYSDTKFISLITCVHYFQNLSDKKFKHFQDCSKLLYFDSKKTQLCLNDPNKAKLSLLKDANKMKLLKKTFNTDNGLPIFALIDKNTLTIKETQNFLIEPKEMICNQGSFNLCKKKDLSSMKNQHLRLDLQTEKDKDIMFVCFV